MSQRTEIVRDVVLKLNHLPTRSIARYLMSIHAGLFDNNLDVARSAVRYARGENGADSREHNPNLVEANKSFAMPETWRTVTEPYLLPPAKWLLINDLHIPFHEKIVIEKAIQYGKKRKVTGIFINGDLQDCQSVSFWPSVIRKDFMKEVMIVNDFFDYLQQEFPGVPIVYKPGNHEYRLPRYYAAKLPDMIGSPVLAMETILDFDGRGIEFLDYFQIVMAGKLPILHGHEVRISTAVNPARGLFLKAKSWALCGHSHRTSEHTGTNINDDYLTTWSVGCCCDLHPEYNPIGNDWNWGLAIVENKENGDFEVENKRVLPSFKVV